jgi:hypothetical protein
MLTGLKVSKLVGQGREAVEVVTRLEVDDVASGPSGRVVVSAAAVLVVSIRDVVLLVVPATLLTLSGIAFAVAVIDAWAQILSVELVAEVILVDLFVVVGSCRVVTRLGMVGRVLLAHTLGLCSRHV